MKKILMIILVLAFSVSLWGADSTRTRSALETLFGDNVAGNISAQDLRDFLASVFIQTDDDTLDILGEYLDSTGINYLNSLFDTGVTNTEFDKLDGFTGTYEDLNYAKDVRATGVTSSELDKVDGYTGDATELNYAKSLYDTGVTNTEFDYLDGVTSNIQDQLDSGSADSIYTRELTVTDSAYIDTLTTVTFNATNVDVSNNIETAAISIESNKFYLTKSSSFYVSIQADTLNLADDETENMLVNPKQVFIEVADTSGNYLKAYIYNSSNITLIDSVGNVANTDSDGDLCLYYSAPVIYIKNRTGSSQIILYRVTQRN